MRIYQSHGFFPGLLRNGAVMSPGDNIVLDPISHGANVWPWIQLAKALNVEVRYLPTHQEGFPRSGRMGSHPKNPWTLQWKGLNLNSRGRVLKITSFEGPMILRVVSS